MMREKNMQSVIHVRFAGRSSDILMSALSIGAVLDDGRIKRALARYLEIPEFKLDDYVIDRHSNGNMTIRPEAVFG